MAGKRGNGEGSISLRSDGRWVARFTMPDGKVRALYGATRQEAARKLSKAIHDRDAGIQMASDERMTLAHWLTRWLETVEPTIKPRTFTRYGVAVRIHLIPALGNVRLSKLSPSTVQTFYARKLKEGLAPGTVAHMHSVLHHALDDAERLGLVAHNISDKVTHPHQPQREMHVLTQEQAQTLLASVKGERLEALYILALTTGARQGELLALRWSDVDLDTATMHISHTLQFRKGGGWYLGSPKTSRGRRRVHLPPVAVAALRKHKARQSEERLALGEAWPGHPFIFTTILGQPIRGTHFTDQFQLRLKRAGLPMIRFHDLRHTAATLLLLANVPAKVVSEMLGHSSISITLDVYSHVLPSMQESAAQAMERALGG